MVAKYRNVLRVSDLVVPIHAYVWPSKKKFTLALSRILSSTLWGEYLVLISNPPDPSRLCAREKGRGLSI